MFTDVHSRNTEEENKPNISLLCSVDIFMQSDVWTEELQRSEVDLHAALKTDTGCISGVKLLSSEYITWKQPKEGECFTAQSLWNSSDTQINVTRVKRLKSPEWLSRTDLRSAVRGRPADVDAGLRPVGGVFVLLFTAGCSLRMQTAVTSPAQVE